jgi:putative oxidoreductase
MTIAQRPAPSDANCMNWVLRTWPDWAALVIRVALAVVFFPHGAQKALGWYGGGGFSATMQGFSSQFGPVLAFLAITAEFAGSIGLFIGFLSRIAAFGVLCNMLVAVALVHSRFGFFMNWTGRQAGEGFEYHLLAIGMLVAIIIRGGGAWSVDLALTRPRAQAAGI